MYDPVLMHTVTTTILLPLGRHVFILPNISRFQPLYVRTGALDVCADVQALLVLIPSVLHRNAKELDMELQTGNFTKEVLLTLVGPKDPLDLCLII